MDVALGEYEMAKRQQRDSNLRSYAVIGAEQRLLQIAEEARAISGLFPELRAVESGDSVLAVGGESPFPLGSAGSGKTAGSLESLESESVERGKMSAAARKRISEAQKARWAKQKRTGR